MPVLQECGFAILDTIFLHSAKPFPLPTAKLVGVRPHTILFLVIGREDLVDDFDFTVAPEISKEERELRGGEKISTKNERLDFSSIQIGSVKQAWEVCNFIFILVFIIF